MENTRDKFQIEIKERRLVITCMDGNRTGISFKPGEALMLLDILKNEESELRRMADEDSPMPVGITIK